MTTIDPVTEFNNGGSITNIELQSGPKVLVTGASGFVGLALVRRLILQGLEVVAACRNSSTALEESGALLAYGDIRDLNFLKKAARGCEIVFHVAAKAGIWGDWQEYYQINVQGTENVIKACLHNSVASLLYTSTPSVVFDQNHIEGGDESLPYPTKFLCNYAKSKTYAEKSVLLANQEGLKTVALRPHLIWGPGDTNLIPRLLDRGRKGLLKQVGDGQNRVDISYIDNVIDAHLLAADDLQRAGCSAGKPYFISQGEPVVLWEWINDLFARLAIPPVYKKVSYKKAYWAGGVIELIYKVLQVKKEPLMSRFLAQQLAKAHWFRTNNAQRDFGYSPRVSTKEGMERLVEWLDTKKVGES